MPYLQHSLNILYSHCTRNCSFCPFLQTQNFCLVTKNYSKSTYFWVFILPKKKINWFQKNFHKSWMVDRRMLPEAYWIVFLMFYRLVFQLMAHCNPLFKRAFISRHFVTSISYYQNSSARQEAPQKQWLNGIPLILYTFWLICKYIDHSYKNIQRKFKVESFGRFLHWAKVGSFLNV